MPGQAVGAVPCEPLAFPFATTVAKRLFAARPDRMLFGTKWPHPHSHPPPDETTWSTGSRP